MSSEKRTSVPNSLNEHWMPFTSNKDFKENPKLIVEAKGVYLLSILKFNYELRKKNIST